MILALWLSVAGAAEPGWTIAETPDWVVVQDVPETAPLRGERADGQFLLDDLQVDARDGVSRYYRDVLRVGSVAGIQDYAEQSFAFDPSFQTLILHHIALVRDGQVIDALRPDELRVVQQERDLDLRIYNGELQVLAFLNDVRVGDVIDRAWTVEGTNPALAGHFLDVFHMGHESPIGRLHRRLLWPADRYLHIKEYVGAPKPKIVANDQQVQYSWAIDGVPARKWDGYAPGWIEQRPWVQLSDFETWSEVVDWALPYYEPGEISAELAAAIEGWKNEPDPESRLAAALAFVQDDVRYLGIEMGLRGLIPHGASETFGRRFGDCKDKSLLLVTALNEMGIEAHPALVHTHRRQGIRELHPTAYAFNHAIVRAKLNGEDLWLDATRSYERGPPSAMAVPAFRAALVLESGGSALSDISTPKLDNSQVSKHESFSLDSLYGPAKLIVRTNYQGQIASAVRRQFESQALENIRAQRLRQYADRFPGVQSEAPHLQVIDDPATGDLQVVEYYTLEKLWDEGSLVLVGSEARNWLVDPPPGARNRALDIAHPILRRHIIDVQLPQDFDIGGSLDSVKTDTFEFVADRTYNNRRLRFDMTYRSLRDHVPADAIEEHREAVEKAAELAIFWVFDVQVDEGMDLGTKGAIVGIALVMLVFLGAPTRRAWVAFRRRKAFDARLRNRSADSPQTAVLVEDTVQANRALKRMRCACGAPLEQGVPKSANIRHNGLHLLMLDSGCTRCDDRTVCYFKFRT